MRELIQAGDREAALSAMSDAFAAAGGRALGWLFFGFIALIGLNATLGSVRLVLPWSGRHDVLLHQGCQAARMSKLYAVFLWGVIIFGIIILLGSGRRTAAVLDMFAFLSTFAMGAYCVTCCW